MVSLIKYWAFQTVDISIFVVVVPIFMRLVAFENNHEDCRIGRTLIVKLLVTDVLPFMNTESLFSTKRSFFKNCQIIV